MAYRQVVIAKLLLRRALFDHHGRSSHAAGPARVAVNRAYPRHQSILIVALHLRAGAKSRRSAHRATSIVKM